jgi:hypothetical protein
LFRTKTDKQEIDFNGTPESLLMMKLRIQNTELNTTTARLERKRSSLSLTLSLSLRQRISSFCVAATTRGNDTQSTQKAKQYQEKETCER